MARGHSRSQARGYARTDRLGELLREIVAGQIERIDDERLDLVTITGVDVDRELERARIFYTSMGATPPTGAGGPAAEEVDEARDQAVVAALAEHRGRIRKAVGEQARVRRVPELVFTPDDSLRSAERIERIIRDLNADGSPRVERD
jgi:ribosome-binding factor A